MDEDTIADLKQFITGAIRQETSDIRQTMQQVVGRLGSLEGAVVTLGQKVTILDQKVILLDQKMDDGFKGIAEAFDANDAEHEVHLRNHEQRLTRLEAKTT